MKTGSDIVIETLEDEAVDVCFANPGTTEMWLVKSLSASIRVRTILALHETVCSGACDGYARMRRRPALCLLHMGPGFANALCNLHNAKRARSPVITVVGDMATWHAASDAPLCTDINSLAQIVSCSVHIPSATTDLRKAARKACLDALAYPEDPLRSRVSTLILPHDLSWEEVSEAIPPRHPGLAEPPVDEICHETKRFLDDCIKKIQSPARGKVAIIIGGLAALADADAIVMVGKVAAKLGAALYCENSFSRVDRGHGRPHLRRLPYFPQDALRELSAFTLIVTLDCRLPVAQFGYKDGPSDLINLADEDLWQIDAGEATPLAIRYLYTQVEANSIIPGENCGGLFPSLCQSSSLPDGNLTPASMCAVIARLQPENAIVVDESITSGGQYWELSKGCPPFTHLTLTGGAIGCGPAMAIGAAVACPDRAVINFQADGSAMYAPQAFWTQVKEELRIITVICSNRTYAILKLEVAKQGIRDLHGQKLGRLTDLSKPEIDWVQLAASLGMPAVKARTTQDLASHLQAALQSDKGPFLIEAVL